MHLEITLAVLMIILLLLEEYVKIRSNDRDLIHT